MKLLAPIVLAALITLPSACLSTHSAEAAPPLALTPSTAPAPQIRTCAEHPGFQWATDADGRTWVWRADEAPEFSEKHVTLVGKGPGGSTLKALDRATAQAFCCARPGFRTEVVDGRVHVWPAGSTGEMSEKRVTRIGAGPDHMTVIAPDTETLNAYVAALAL